ncbi:MAG: GTPase ObgE [bacterium]|nr:GTPase ObgE [bacterium]
MLIDDITITLAAGHGGPGKSAFDKNALALGPTGGSGGRGGNIYIEGSSNIDLLNQFRYKKEVRAEDGEAGKIQLNDGAHGEDLVIKIPVGTVIHNLTTKKDIEVLIIGEKTLFAKGGFGGKGNYRFRSPTNTSPTQTQPGLPGEEFELRLELKLIADVGFVGLPNVGKSSLINEITNTQSKVANYPFTTLEPALGVYHDLILADIPGLIEGASKGKGLGIKFLRHVERTGTLFHFISAESTTPVADYKTIRKELKAHNPELMDKPEYIFVSKSDEVDEKELKKKITILKKHSKKVMGLSILKDDDIKAVEKILSSLSNKKSQG